MHEPQRRCITCRTLCPRRILYKVTYCKRKNQFSLNDNPPLQGRSAYVCNNRTCILEALKGKKLQRALKRAVCDAILSNLSNHSEGLKA
jgi:predicted RNA-binding protein YlxR (DUF448 family)